MVKRNEDLQSQGVGTNGRSFPRLDEVWRCTSVAVNHGPLDNKTVRLLKLAVATDALRDRTGQSSGMEAIIDCAEQKPSGEEK